MDDKIVTVTATKDQITDFIESLLWKDIKQELNAWKEGFRSELGSIAEDAATENPSTASVLIHLGDVNGRAKAVDYLLSLPNIFLQILEEQKDDSERK